MATFKSTPSSSRKDITRCVISNDLVRNEIGNFFPHSIILDENFQIVTVCKKVCKILGFLEDELKSKPIGTVTNTLHIEQLLGDILKTGFFKEHLIELKTSKGQGIAFSISGFYLGLISDFNNLIILNLKDFEEIKSLHYQLAAKSIEVDNFVYQAAHSLRGPLASIKGLIYLAKECKEEVDFNSLVEKMDCSAKQLDDLLTTISNFANSDKLLQLNHNPISFSSIAKKLDLLTKDSSSLPSLPKITFKRKFKSADTLVDKGDLILSALTHITTYFLKQNRGENSELIFSCSSNNSYSEFEMRSKGIKMSKIQMEKLESVNFGYVDIMNEPEMANLYSAKKIVFKLKGRICFNLATTHEVSVYILIPKSFHGISSMLGNKQYANLQNES